MNRRLALRREVLGELTDVDLSALAGGQGGSDTCASCLTFVSCHLTDCILRPTIVKCIDYDPGTLAGC